MADARSLLAAISAVTGVSVAVVMDRGGFVIEWAGEGMEAEDLAAVASDLLESCDGVGRDLGQGGMRKLICEFEEGVVLVMGGDAATRLAVALRDPSALDAVRHVAGELMLALERL
ncbi:MAG TPA: roadblock/LC7 domain-containing protein [Candidatus Methylomirabilis sp.]|nr:roadblock/LC7 domain-containing protein [Candidatus Methylomirabilis sp.]